MRPLWRLLTLLATAAAICALPLIGEPYYVKLVTRILVYGMAAIALNLVVGLGGMISFGHAAFFGIGAYVAGILATHDVQQAIVVWPIAMLVAGAGAAIVAALSLRTSGIFFIFVTLAFAQMIYYVARSLRAYGGDDGFAMPGPTDLGFGLTSSNPTALFFVASLLSAIVLLFNVRLVASRFGQVVQAARDNRRRAAAIGLSIYPYQVSLFAISGAIAGLAGALDAVLTAYVTPMTMNWVASGDLLMMVILGSTGTVIGPLLGAAVFIFFEQALSDLTPHWMLLLGPILVGRVLYLNDGFVSSIVARFTPRTPP